MGLVIADCGRSLLLPFWVAHPETRRAGLNEPVLLGPGQNGETKRGNTMSDAGYLSHSNFTVYISLTHKIESSHISDAISDQTKKTEAKTWQKKKA